MDIMDTPEKVAKSTLQTSRPRIIPFKRPLLPAKSIYNHRVSKVLNPSAIPAETHFKSSHEEATQKRQQLQNSDNKDKDERSNEDEDYSPKIPRTEVSFSMPPQPFLDPPTWEAMLKHSHQRLETQSTQSTQATSSDHHVGEQVESAEQLRQRVDRETEYGSMAIRGRSSVRGRGRRGRGNGNVYWGGAH